MLFRSGFDEVGVSEHGKEHLVADAFLPAMFKGLDGLEQIAVRLQVVTVQLSPVFLLWAVEEDPESIDRRLESFIRKEPEAEYGFVCSHGDSGMGRLNDMIPICRDGVKGIAGHSGTPKREQAALFSSHKVIFLI